MPAIIDEEKCNGCESCVEEYPSEAIKMVDDKAEIDVDSCIECAVCVDACPVEAIGIE